MTTLPAQTRTERLSTFLDISSKFLQCVAILMAGYWAIYKFYYEDKVLPSKLKPYLTVQTDLAILGTKADLVTIKARVTAKNATKARFELLGSWFNVIAYKITERPEGFTSAEEHSQYSLLALNLGQLHRGSGTILEFPEGVQRGVAKVVNRGRLLPADWRFHPNEEVTTEFLAFVPREYDLVELRANFRAVSDKEGFRVTYSFKGDGRIELMHKYTPVNPFKILTDHRPEISYSYAISHITLWSQPSLEKERQAK